MSKRRNSDTMDLFPVKSTRTEQEAPGRQVKFAAQLKALNTQFSAWVAQQAVSNPNEVWMHGAEDYLHYAKQLLAEFKDVIDGKSTVDEQAKPAAPAAGPSLFNFGGSSAPALAASSVPAFSFGTAPAFGAAAPAQEEDDEPEKDEPEEVQIETSDVDVLLKQRVTVLSATPEKKWADRGAGVLTLRRSKSGGRPYMVFTTDTGRVLINAPLLQGLKPQTNPKTPRNLIMMLANTAAGSVQQGMYVIKCEDAEAVKKLRGAILEHV